LKNLIYVDSTGAEELESLLNACRKQGVRLIVSGVMSQPLDILRRTGLIDGLQGYLQPDLAAGLSAALTAQTPGGSIPSAADCGP
jgi:SulP family sulfate permease